MTLLDDARRRYEGGLARGYNNPLLLRNYELAKAQAATGGGLTRDAVASVEQYQGVIASTGGTRVGLSPGGPSQFRGALPDASGASPVGQRGTPDQTWMQDNYIPTQGQPTTTEGVPWLWAVIGAAAIFLLARRG